MKFSPIAYTMIEKYRTISLDELKKDRDKRNMVLHPMLVSIQSAIDISNH